MKIYLTKVGISARDLDLDACIGLGGTSAFNILDQCLCYLGACRGTLVRRGLTTSWINRIKIKYVECKFSNK